ncbi:MAG: hypothetical protein AAF922_02735 [Pseudomonadota bacterium]
MRCAIPCATAITLLILAGCDSTSNSANTADQQTGNDSRSGAEAYDLAVTSFIEACVKTAANPGLAPAAFENLGFSKSSGRNGQLDFSAHYATAKVSRRAGGGPTNEFGQCSVTPKAGSFQTSAALLSQKISNPDFAARRIPSQVAWSLGDTGTLAIVSFEMGAMVRTQKVGVKVVPSNTQ